MFVSEDWPRSLRIPFTQVIGLIASQVFINPVILVDTFPGQTARISILLFGSKYMLLVKYNTKAFVIQYTLEVTVGV